MKVDVPRAIVLYLLWLGLISGVLLVGMSDALPVKLGFIRPENVFTLLIEAELFFVLVIWPFFVPRLLVPKVSIDAAKLHSPGGEAHVLMLQVGVLFVVALPVALLCSNIANVTMGAFLRGHLLVAVMAAFVASLWDVAAERRINIAPAYALGLMTLSALCPFAYSIAKIHADSDALFFLSGVSPFWAATYLDPESAGGSVPLVMSGVFGALTVALFAFAPFLRRPAVAAN